MTSSIRNWSNIPLFCIAETEKGIFDAILEGEIDFESPPWPSISTTAKDLIRRMLTQDPKKRITSAQVLGIEPFSFVLENSLSMHLC